MASAWLQAMPSERCFELPTPVFQAAVKLRLGMAVLPREQRCMCGRDAGPQPDHYLVCKYGHHRSLRHDQVAIQIKQLHTALGKVARVTGLDAVLPDASNGAHLIPDVYCPELAQVVDVSITFPGAAAYVAGAASEDGWAAQVRETGKVTKYRASAASVGLAFHPAVFETFGRAGLLFKAWFGDMVAEAEDRLPDGWSTNWSARTFSAHFQQRISVALQRGNAEVVLQRARRDY